MEIHESTAIYKAVDGIDLALHLFLPEQTNGQRSAILFLHGGRFVQGHPAQFFPHCRYFASRGMVAASASYRLLGKNASSVWDCIADSRDAIRWFRSQTANLAFDPTKIVAAGGSAGANLAANAVMGQYDEEVESGLTISARPNALVLFSPAIVRPASEDDLIDEQLFHHLQPRPQLPPMLLLHGADDEFFTRDRMQHFCEQMTAAGNLCLLKLYPNQGHGFFNYGREENRPFYETVLETNRFLNRIGMLDGKPTLTNEMMDLLRHKDDWPA